MNNFSYERIEHSCKILHLDLSASELANIASDNDMSTAQLNALDYVLDYLREKKEIATVEMKHLHLKEMMNGECLQMR